MAGTLRWVSYFSVLPRSVEEVRYLSFPSTPVKLYYSDTDWLTTEVLTRFEPRNFRTASEWSDCTTTSPSCLILSKIDSFKSWSLSYTSQFFVTNLQLTTNNEYWILYYCHEPILLFCINFYFIESQILYNIMNTEGTFIWKYTFH